ncbi:MAG: hypothetical protein K2Q10_13990 [Rhodospirillales bacterium]|nr:hypothetical protein [Rhodospirillales bacterium]
MAPPITQLVLEASPAYLAEACAAMGVDGNAVRQGAEDARLLVPSFFCPEPETWMRVLAILLAKAVPVRLYIRQVEDPRSLADDEAPAVISRIHPRFDEEMLSLLRDLCPEQAAVVEDVGMRMRQSPSGRLARMALPEVGLFVPIVKRQRNRGRACLLGRWRRGESPGACPTMLSSTPKATRRPAQRRHPFVDVRLKPP